MKISVVIPVYNEVNTIAAIVERVRNVPLEKEIIIVDDCSTDGTRDELKRLGEEDGELKIVYQDRNRGKGAALRQGFRYVEGEIVIIQDADLEYYPEEYPQLVEPIIEGKADVVYGSRFLGRHRVFMLSHYLGNKLLNIATNILYNSVFTDMETCYKAFRTSILKRMRLHSNGFGFEPEFTATVMKLGYKVYEIPISYDGRSYTEGKKITWRDGFVSLYWLLRCRFMSLDVDRETLLEIETMRRYNDWIYEWVEPFLGNRILEIKSGIGNITRKLLRKPFVIASDFADEHLQALHKRFVEGGRLRIMNYNPGECDANRFHGQRLDTILCLNVLQVLERDQAVLESFYEILEPGGRLAVLVAGCGRLHSGMDRILGHLRRYSKSDLSRKIEQAGFTLEFVRYLNLPGAIGWFLNGAILRRKKLPRCQIRIFDLFAFFLRIEKRLKVPFGLSLLAVARKKEARD
jgi:glycosyltransferase involved in cell wall biosynthesis